MGAKQGEIAVTDLMDTELTYPENKMKKFVYKGLEYEENFGKLVRKLDREQAALNERKRIAFFDRREEELEPKYRKIMYKDVRAEGLKRYDEDEKWKEYEALMEEQIIKEWNKIKPSSRDWQKVKVICFDQNGKP